MRSILADIIWPALFLEERLISIPGIALSLAIEYLFVWRVTSLGAWRSIFADLAMNTASTVLGIFLIPLLGLVWEFLPGILLYRLFNWGTFNPLTWGVTFCLAVLVNAALETLVLTKGFRQRIGKRGFGLLCIANGITVGIAMATFLFRPMRG